MILTAMPYAPDRTRNYGRALNEFFDRLLPGDWGFVLDHDAAFTTSDWFTILERSIKAEPEAGAFTCMMNRLPGPTALWQIEPDIDHTNDDYEYHRRIGRALADRPLKLIDVTTPPDRGRVLNMAFCLRKETWHAIGGFSEDPPRLCDHDKFLHVAVRRLGKRILLIRNLYLYHWIGRSRPIWKAFDDAGTAQFPDFLRFPENVSSEAGP